MAELAAKYDKERMAMCCLKADLLYEPVDENL
jgi:hypothetical protein